MVFIGPACKVLYSRYHTNNGLPLVIVADMLQEAIGSRIVIRSACVTSYGAEKLKTAPEIDFEIVETMALFKKTHHFNPDVDFIINIRGQDKVFQGLKKVNQSHHA